jgi:hypothetical protein
VLVVKVESDYFMHLLVLTTLEVVVDLRIPSPVV